MKLTKSEILRRFYDAFSGEDHVLVLINADPDAIASAMAVKRLLWRKVASVGIAHVNVIKRPDNQEMIRLLGVKMVHTDAVDAARFTKVVMVDSQPSHHEKLAAFSPDVVIDHHPDSGVRAPFADIRPTYGATASILTEYLRSARIKPSKRLATALFHAIKVDTRNFERQTLLQDLKAFQYNFRHANVHLARRIEQAEISFDFLKYFRLAFDTLQLRKGRVFVHLGRVSNPDVCVVVADFFMRLTYVSWTIISGVNRGKLIVVIRNDGLRKDAGSAAHAGFGHIGSAGGHKSMARAEIPLHAITETDPGDDKSVSHWIVRRFEAVAGSGQEKRGRPEFTKEIFGLTS